MDANFPDRPSPDRIPAITTTEILLGTAENLRNRTGLTADRIETCSSTPPDSACPTGTDCARRRTCDLVEPPVCSLCLATIEEPTRTTPARQTATIPATSSPEERRPPALSPGAAPRPVHRGLQRLRRAAHHRTTCDRRVLRRFVFMIGQCQPSSFDRQPHRTCANFPSDELNAPFASSPAVRYYRRRTGIYDAGIITTERHEHIRRDPAGLLVGELSFHPAPLRHHRAVNFVEFQTCRGLRRRYDMLTPSSYPGP